MDLEIKTRVKERQELCCVLSMDLVWPKDTGEGPSVFFPWEYLQENVQEHLPLTVGFGVLTSKGGST